jgi:hypothetical protein
MRGKRKFDSIYPSTRVKYPGIGAAAQVLGVSRFHLWSVVEGRRQSRRLLRRYQDLLGNGGAK